MKIVLVMAAALLTVMLQAQESKDVRLYAFSQPVTPGAQQARDIDEGGNRLPSHQPGLLYSYLFYAASSSTARLYPVALWVNGTRYGAKTKVVAKTPVTHTDYTNPASPQTRILVPKTSKKVLEITPLDSYAEKDFPAAERLAASNEVVFVFRQNGKFLWQTVSKMTPLEAAAMQ